MRIQGGLCLSHFVLDNQNKLACICRLVGWNYKDIGLSPAKFGAVWFSADLDPLGGPNQKSTGCRTGTLEEFEKSKMAAKMVANSLNWL